MAEVREPYPRVAWASTLSPEKSITVATDGWAYTTVPPAAVVESGAGHGLAADWAARN